MSPRSRLIVVLVAATAAPVTFAQHVRPAYSGQILPAGDKATDIAIGDIDEDGWPDVAIASVFSVAGTLLRSDGHGVLHSAGTLPSGFHPSAIALADVDEDGHLDLLGFDTNGPLDALAVLTGDGQGGFTPAWSTLFAGGVDLLVADANEDGHLDLVVTAFAPDRLLFAAGVGDGSFGPLVPLPLPGSEPWELAGGDVDGDGHFDLVVSFLLSHAVWTFRGDGDGGFVPDTRLADLDETRFMTLGDLDGDGDLDVVVSTKIGGNQSLGWFAGNGSGDFLPRQTLPNPANGWGPVGIADFDGDGDTDVALGLNSSYLLAFSLQLTPGVFTAGPLWTLPGISEQLGLADLDGDGRTDLVSSGGIPGRARLFLGNTAGMLATSQAYATDPDPRALDVGDLDGDGHGDVVALGRTDFAQEFLMVLAGQADGSLGAPTLNPVVSNGDTSKDWLVLHDLDGDGRLDVALIDQSGFKVIVRLGDGHLGFLPQLTIWVPPFPTFVTAGDVTADGVADIVTVHEADAQVSVLPGLGGGAFGAPIPLSVDGNPIRAVIADVDGDGDNDIAVAHGSTKRITLLHDDGGGAFTPSVILSTTSLRAIAAGDLDADGDVDLAVGGVALDIYRGDGAGGFVLVPSQPFPEGSLAHTLRLADVDRDGRLDVLAGIGSPFVSVGWLHNAGDAQFEGPWCHLAASSSVMSIGDISGQGGVDVVFVSDGVSVLSALIVGPWSDLGQALAGSLGDPHLYAQGSLTPSSPLKLLLDAASPSTLATLVLGFSVAELPFKGGTMVPYPNLLVAGLATNVSGKLKLSATWPAAVPPGMNVVLQYWLADPSGPAGLTASNAIVAVTP